MNNIAKRAQKIFNLKQFNNLNYPELIKHIKVYCPYDRQYILRMLIKEAYSDFKIPEELKWVEPIIKEAYKYQKEVVKIEHSFCYVTIRHGLVTSVTDDEWHVDGFSTLISHIPEQNYGWANCYPTEYIVQKVKFPKDFNPLIHNAHPFIQNVIEKETKVDQIQTIPSCMLFCFDPYVIHKRPQVPKNIIRTFVRVSFDPIEIKDINNTPNPLIPKKYTRDGMR
jgi:hypothetical protein